jgi:hypothetical protein
VQTIDPITSTSLNHNDQGLVWFARLSIGFWKVYLGLHRFDFLAEILFILNKN